LSVCASLSLASSLSSNPLPTPSVWLLGSEGEEMESRQGGRGAWGRGGKGEC
jgi:hypothetical protein